MKPRILMVIPLPPPVHGSAAVSSQILESELVREEYELIKVNSSTSRDMAEIGNWSVRKAFRYLNSLIKLFSYLIRYNPDLCYLAITCHGKGFLKDAPFALMCKLFRKKIIIHQHNRGMADDIDRPIYRRLIPLVYRNAKVILLSRLLYPDISKTVPLENVLICPNGIHPSAPENLIHTPNRIPHILFLSNLLIEKGVLVLLDALEILKNKGYSFSCDFIGGETAEISAERFSKEARARKLEENVRYHGSKYGKGKSLYYEKADIFAFPTFYSNEAFPLVILEAMDYRLPVVTTDVGGIPDLVIDGINGLTVKQRDSVSLSDALAKLIDNPELRKKMGEEGHRIFLERYTDTIFEKRLTSLLGTLLN